MARRDARTSAAAAPASSRSASCHVTPSASPRPAARDRVDLEAARAQRGDRVAADEAARAGDEHAAAHGVKSG